MSINVVPCLVVSSLLLIAVLSLCLQYLEDAIQHRQDGEDCGGVDKQAQEEESGEEEEEGDESEGEQSGDDSKEDEEELGRTNIKERSASLLPLAENEVGGEGDASIAEGVSEGGAASELVNTSDGAQGQGVAGATPMVAMKGFRKQRKQAVRAVQSKTRSVQRSRNSTKDKGGRRSRHVRSGGDE